MTVIDFQKFDLLHCEDCKRFLQQHAQRGCAYSFANLNLWGRQQAAFLEGYLVLFSQFDRSSVYPFPVGSGDLKPVLDAIIKDAQDRGILCRLTCLSAEDCMVLEELYPGKFQFHPDRDGCDYVYKIEDLATLSGRKYQKKRNHLNKFRQKHPDCKILSLDESTRSATIAMLKNWYASRLEQDPNIDLLLEQRAMRRAFHCMEALGLEGLVLEEKGEVLAMAMGSRLSEDTFDIHFEKAREDVDGAYPAINQAFAAHLMDKYPTLRYLNREDDMGIEGLRKAKLSYYPDHLITKFWARLWEDADED